MKRRPTAKPWYALPLLLLAFSCASTPPKEPEPEPPKPPVEAPAPEKPAPIPAPAEAKAAAEKARAEAALFEAETAFPNEWKAADASFAAGAAAYEKDNAASKTAYEAAAKAFGDLAVQAKPLFLEKLAKAKASAEKERKQAFDLDAQSAFPDDWRKAEALFVKGRETAAAGDSGKIASYPEALSSYRAAAEAYDSLSRRTLPLFANARKSELDKARNDALAAKADKLAPSRFSAADAETDKVYALFAKADYYAAYDAWKAARTRYLALATGARAYSVKEEIDRRGLAAYDSGNYARAGERLDASMSAFDSGKPDASLDAAEESHLRYKLALAKGRELYAGDRGKAAEAERVAAWELKAHVAVKADYEAAAKRKVEADASFKSEKYDEAAEQYQDAEQRFSVVRKTAAEKRLAAEEAIKAAERRMQESEKTAQEGDAVLEGGAR